MDMAAELKYATPSTAIDTNRTQGWYLPKNSYTGTVDITLSNTSPAEFPRWLFLG